MHNFALVLCLSIPEFINFLLTFGLQLMDLLFSFLDPERSHSSQLAGYFSKVGYPRFGGSQEWFIRRYALLSIVDQKGFLKLVDHS